MTGSDKPDENGLICFQKSLDEVPGGVEDAGYGFTDQHSFRERYR